MKKQNNWGKLILFISLFMCSIGVFAQGSTTSAMSGSVTDASGSLLGATVIAVHVPTGSEYATVTNEEGFFRIVNMETGGPYRLNVSYVGYQTYEVSDIFLRLGQTTNLNVTLQEATEELDEVVVVGSNTGSSTTGSGSNLGRDAIDKAPTVARDLTDFTRLDPRASISNSPNGNATTFSGVNNRYNAIFIDGAVNNDLFGLSTSGTNGGQAGISPISVDAIKEIQISVAPYDVTKGGFAGGSVNAVTRTGTNELEGSLYYLTRNQNLAGKTPTDNESVERTKLPDFTAKTFGFRVGGPIVKNKLFFFVNTEFQRDETPFAFPLNDYNGASSIDRIDEVRARLLNDYGYETGDFRNTLSELKGEKVIAKFNWNINQNHKLSLRHSYVKGVQSGEVLQGVNRIQFSNSAVFFPSTTNSTALELNSRFGDNKSNKLILGYTSVVDDRDITGDPFPSILINDGNATITAGSEPFSYSNVVDQKTFSITDNFTIYKNKHTLTFGTHNEFYKILNVFLPLHPAQYQYSSIDKFFADEAFLYLYGHTVGNTEIGDDAISASANFNAAQLAFYVQDEIQLSEKFKLTGGLRFDVPIFGDDAPLINDDFNTNTIPLLEAAGYDLEGAEASRLPKSQILVSPRLGFEYDIKGDGLSKLRGGAGIFTSRVPFVWPGGVYLRNGLSSGFTAEFNGSGFAPPGAGGIPLNPDVNNQNFNDTNPSGDVDIFAENFKFPQVFKTNLSYEKTFESGLFALIDVQYTKTLNNLLVQNVNRERNPTGTLTGTPDDRPVFSGDFIDPDYNFITLMTNTSKGSTFSTSFQLQKRFGKNLNASASYNFTRARSIIDGTEFINSDNWKRFHSINGRNFPGDPQISQFDTGSRFTGLLSWNKEFKFTETLISLFYNGQSGQRYSYVYNDQGALNNDNPGNSENRNLIYVPANQSDIVLVDTDFNGDDVIGAGETAAEQWAALNSFIEGDDYLSERRGQYAERNGARTPFESVLDLKIEQSFFIKRKNGKKHDLKFSLDIFNFTNFLNKDWGRRYIVNNRGNTSLIGFQGFQDDGTTPTFSFQAPTNGEAWNIFDAGINSARWQAQFGVRYSF
ncbi:TonB-dependent receptor [Maribacter sp. 2210JD10-5]|uniref:TonB-dependent receptor n=1 Tax=Maribacter sp. 2210JD10-5 TaxID=3386272 RepID=UPI0039BC99D5